MGFYSLPLDIMKRYGIILVGIMVFMSTLSTTCFDDYESKSIDITIINDSDKDIYCTYYFIIDGYISNSPIMHPCDTLEDHVFIQSDTQWDKNYINFLFHEELNQADIENFTGYSQCYNLIELQEMEWTVIYRGDEN